MDNSMSNMSAGSGTGESGRPMEQVREQAREVVDRGQEMAGRAVDQARTQIKSQLSTQKDNLAGSIDGVAQALRTTGSQLPDNSQNLSPLVDRAAEMIEGFSGYLREHDLEDLVVEVESIARRNPGVFLGATFAVGFVMARFFKSSSAEAYREAEYRGGRSIHTEDVHRGYEASEYRMRRLNREYGGSYDRPAQGESSWSTGSAPMTGSTPTTGAMPSTGMGTMPTSGGMTSGSGMTSGGVMPTSPARETPTMTQPAVTDNFTADADDTDEGIAYTRTTQD